MITPSAWPSGLGSGSIRTKGLPARTKIIGEVRQQNRSRLHRKAGGEWACPMVFRTAIPTLFRGDSLPRSPRPLADPGHRGRTFPDHYITDGLVAKHADGGSPATFRKPLS